MKMQSKLVIIGQWHWHWQYTCTEWLFKEQTEMHRKDNTHETKNHKRELIDKPQVNHAGIHYSNSKASPSEYNHMDVGCRGLKARVCSLYLSVFFLFTSNILETAQDTILLYLRVHLETHILVRSVFTYHPNFLGHYFFFCVHFFIHFIYSLWVCARKDPMEKCNGMFMFCGMLTQWRVFRVYFNTLSSWALGKFQFCTIAIEPSELTIE